MQTKEKYYDDLLGRGPGDPDIYGYPKPSLAFRILSWIGAFIKFSVIFTASIIIAIVILMFALEFAVRMYTR